MYKLYFVTLFIFITSFSVAQNLVRGMVTDALSNQPIEGVTVTLLPDSISVLTDSKGIFVCKKSNRSITSVSFSSVGYSYKTISIQGFNQNKNNIALTPETVNLNAVTVSSGIGEQYHIISQADIAMRGFSNSQEVLRIIPGLFIGQHQGGGKAEQIFLRGFDCDHGTDVGLFADGMPVNMVSHAHGQGYADSHFIIPETIGDVVFNKGPYDAAKGDFSTAGSANFITRNAIDRNVIRLEGGMFGTVRVLAMLNLLPPKAIAKQQSWYFASEYKYSNSYFDNPQHFNRFNFFTKYSGNLSQKTHLSLSASHLWSKWNASGQIPEEAVDKGVIGFYGAIDPNEGGVTTRTNVNAQFLASFENGDLVKNQFYYSHYTFDLHTNFTFFLVDSTNGDEIRQKESRNLFGYNGSYRHISNIGATRLTTEAGINIRIDATSNSGLSHTKNRYTEINAIKLGDITEAGFSPYWSETLRFTDKLSLNAGLRFDAFYFRYNNKLSTDSTLPGMGFYKASDNIVSPKLSVNYKYSNTVEFYVSAGRGFHSNDARSAVVVNGANILPKAYGADAGTVCKAGNKVIVTAALWYLYLTQENVYGGDGGSIEFSGDTKRMGVDFSGRYQPLSSLYFDVDVDYAHGRAAGEAKGNNYIPLAPVWSSTGGVTYATKEGINGSLRYRWLANRPANENYTLTATGYFITDAVLNFTKHKYEAGVAVNNILNTKWKETQFATLYRLKNDAVPTNSICFTPGTPFAITAHINLFF